jgi:LacI family transcriptional regulator
LSTISDVARRAGVSTVTVSRVLNRERNVNSLTRERVERAIADLSYVPNVVARSLRSKRTHALALVLPDVTNVFWTTIARGVEDAAHSVGYSVLLCNTDEDPVKQQLYMQVIASQRVDGVIIAPCDDDAAHLSELRQRNVPTVIMDRRIEGWDVDTVWGDSISGARALIRHLIKVGHRRIAIITGPSHASTADDRVAGYRMALAEASIPFDPCLVKHGEFRAASGEHLTYQLLDESRSSEGGVAHPAARGGTFTAIFAANNVIALGVLDALEKRGLRVPQDVALVSFDDLPEASRLFPFLTVVTQPAYEMGTHAAQLLLSRLYGDTSSPARHVVLPTRLILRYSCGQHLQETGEAALSLPLARGVSSETILVKPLDPEEVRQIAALNHQVDLDTPAIFERSDVERVLTALQHRVPDRVPYVELQMGGKAIYEHVLERELKPDPANGWAGPGAATPEDQVEFARRLGIDAVVCDFQDLSESLTDHLSALERYLRAAHGTGVGVGAAFGSFFGPALFSLGRDRPQFLPSGEMRRLEEALDSRLVQQARLLRSVCDRFAEDLAFILISDTLADAGGRLLPSEVLEQVFCGRMRCLISPAREHGKPVIMRSPGKLEELLPILVDLGVAAIQPLEPQFNDIFALKQQWGDRLSLVGSVTENLLRCGSPAEVEEAVRAQCLKLAPGGGYILSAAAGMGDGDDFDVPPANFVAIARAVHKFGGSGS